MRQNKGECIFIEADYDFKTRDEVIQYQLWGIEYSYSEYSNIDNGVGIETSLVLWI